jgi:hypothetical protein
MHTALLIRASWLSVCLLAFASVSLAQDGPSVSPSPSPTPLRIGYTGKLLGYFRVPSEQARDSFQGCSDREGDKSVDAATFITKIDKNPDTILVGTGDNFSPQLESRVFKAGDAQRDSKEYIPRNKELYTWDFLNKEPKNREWVSIGKESDDLEDRLIRGEGTIPTDNVGCFLAAAHFRAVVPGKHDFYYGTERVRQLARFMAGIDQKGYTPVQMLGANLVIKTARLDGNQAPAATEEWPKNLSAQNLKSVYPWFSAPIHIKLTPPKGDKFLEKLKDWREGSKDITDELTKLLEVNGTNPPMDADEREQWSQYLKSIQALRNVYICPAGEFNEITHADCVERGYPLEQDKQEPKPAPALAPTPAPDFSMTYSFPIKKTDRADGGGKDGHYATFLPGQNYGLCVGVEAQPGGRGGGVKSDLEMKCTVFPVLTPFLSYPRRVPSMGSSYKDPDPFVFIPKTSQANEVAIFGVVDPHLAEQVGVLNFSWLNQDTKLKSYVGIEDPIETLNQQLEYFKQWHKERYEARGGTPEKYEPFSGLKILLAQMSPQRARLLATHFNKEFQVVVAGADDVQATDETEQSIVWTPKSRAAAFVAVPPPAYDAKAKEVVVSLGLLSASREKDRWVLSSEHPADAARSRREIVDERKQAELAREKQEREEKKKSNLSGTEQEKKEGEKKKREEEDTLSTLLREQLAGCLSGAPAESAHAGEQLKLLTLCAMRQRVGADVALLQERDLFFDQLPVKVKDVSEVQSIMDQAIWKGDLLTLLYVPGSALKKALEQSNKYEQEDSNGLSLADEKSRGLLVLGAEKKGKDFVVNELPLDEKKIYAVATSDYIGAGDTGYPDLDAAALNQKTIPAKFPRRLEPISSVVCRRLLSSGDEYKANCLRELDRDKYLDKIASQAAPPQRPTGFGKQLQNLSPFKWPDEAKDPETIGEAAEQHTQRHPIWTLSLQNLSLGFSRVSNNLTDKAVTEKFAGVSTSGISSSKFQEAASLGLGLRFSRTSHRNEFFVAAGIDFKETTTGDESGSKHPALARANNRMTADIGLIRNIRGGRSRDRLGINISLRAETPFRQPFTDFDLGTKTAGVTDRLRVYQGRSLLLLPRVGLRWQSGANSLEVGGQLGGELHALAGYRLETQGAVVECLPNAAEPFAKCVEGLSTEPNVFITPDSPLRAILADRPRAGAYLKFNLTVPISTKVKYEMSNEGDFFFVKWHEDNATDAKYRDEFKNSLKFFVFPNFSFGPTLQLLFYRNKVNGDFLFQKNVGMEASFSFNVFNLRERKVQLRNKPVAAGQ